MQGEISAFKKPLRTLNTQGECWKYVREIQLMCSEVDSDNMTKTHTNPKYMQNLTSEVTFKYFPGLGRADPLRQMFEYHGQPYTKEAEDFESWA